MNRNVIWKIGMLGGIGAGLYYLMTRKSPVKSKGGVIYFDCKKGQLQERTCNNHHNTHTYKFSAPVNVYEIKGMIEVWSQGAEGTTPVAIELSLDGRAWETVKVLQLKNDKIISFDVRVNKVLAKYLRFRAVGSPVGIYKFGYIEYSSGAVYYV